jgi:cytidyltransferase-like protein
MTKKVHTLDETVALLDKRRSVGDRIVLCHGVFDLLHIGHIRHLEAARRLGDLLVVTVVPDHLVDNGHTQPAFSEEIRLESLAALECVDVVLLSPGFSAVEAITTLRPDVYVQGPDHRSPSEKGRNVASEEDAETLDEAAAIRALGGEFVLTDGVVFSASALIHRRLSPLPESTQQWISDFAERYPSRDLIAAVDAIRSLRILIVGEAIMDEYQYVETIGKSSKDPVLAARLLSKQVFAGGTLAIANHVAAFSDNVSLLTCMGESHQEVIRESLDPSIRAELVEWEAPTIAKRRFIEEYSFTKLFETYQMSPNPLTERIDEALRSALIRLLPEHDLVIVADYGHGLLSAESIDLLATKSPYLALNVQANAGNHGYHALSTYPRADYICAAANEFRLEARSRSRELDQIIVDVSNKMSCRKVVITRGKAGCLAYEDDGDHGALYDIPTVANSVVDRVGAGDAFLSLSAPLVAFGLPLEAAAFIGNAASAQAVATVGNEHPVGRRPLYTYLRSVL